MSTTSPYAVTPDVWNAIVPEARATDTRERRATGLVVLAALLLVVASAIATNVGVFTPRLSGYAGFGTGGSGHGNDVTHTGTLEIDIQNTTRFATRIRGAHFRTPVADAVRITSVTLAPDSLAGGANGQLSISFTVNDCAAVRSVYDPDGTLPDDPAAESDAVVVEATTWWGGTRAITLRPVDATIMGSVIGMVCSNAAVS